LDEADRLQIDVSNMALQKILYFAHGFYLQRTGKPLVSGYFEAWQHGPVHPTAYAVFRPAGATPIHHRAQGINIVTGENYYIEVCSDPQVQQAIVSTLSGIGGLSPARLRAISHAEQGPWDYIVKQGGTRALFGMRIPNDVIQEKFRYHKISVHSVPPGAEFDEDTPFA